MRSISIIGSTVILASLFYASEAKAYAMLSFDTPTGRIEYVPTPEQEEAIDYLAQLRDGALAFLDTVNAEIQAANTQIDAMANDRKNARMSAKNQRQLRHKARTAGLEGAGHLMGQAENFSNAINRGAGNLGLHQDRRVKNLGKLVHDLGLSYSR